MSSNWKAVAARKRAETLRKIPQAWVLARDVLQEARLRRDITGTFISSLLSWEERLITDLDSVSLALQISHGVYTALQVTSAFCKRAAFAHQLNNCLHEIFFEDARQRAVELDEYFETTGNTIGPLHGVPISLKDQFHVKNVETTMGYAGWVDTFEGQKDTSQEFKIESQLVTELRSLGAILYCKTSLPQALLVGETVNNLIGTTMNPVNQKLSCGGSSGGEGALQALGGSSLGVGTDIGGSVRIPAAFCGTYSIKPSFGRFSYRRVANSSPGQTIMPSAIGFMATSVLSLKLIMTSLLSTKPWLRDPDVVDMPWRNIAELEVRNTSLCFAVFTNDEKVTPHPPVIRAIKMVVDAVKKAGHKVIQWEPPSHFEACDIHQSFIRADGGADLWKQLGLLHEPLIHQLAELFGTGPVEPTPLLEYQANSLKRKDYSARYMEYWNSTAEKTGTGRAVDAVILPVAPHAAVISGKFYHYGYSEIVNLLDYTSVAIPVTRADKTLDPFDSNYKYMNSVDHQNWADYDPEIYDGAPAGVQLMGRRFDEERMISVAGIVIDALSYTHLEH
ncbi:amidase [Glonium stellatum]|uniref:Amidase n=1 Tax=Glonium stellatum TaxID=574774 RepID=A0A8E2FDK7_9PEZI|nr:amidase [Glonium stellatum]